MCTAPLEHLIYPMFYGLFYVFQIHEEVKATPRLKFESKVLAT